MIGGPALALGGWLVAGWAAWLAWLSWRSRGSRMEAVARACHELRGPLAAARLGLHASMRHGELPAARLRAVELELQRAALALDDLAIAGRRPVARSRTRGEVEIGELLDASVEALREHARLRGVLVTVGWSGRAARVWGDPLRIAQAIANLIANAIEHGGGQVSVRGWAEQSTVRIEVRDTGPGLRAPVATLQRAARGGRGERGRGLAIAAAIAADHGGRLAAAPSERGARLVLELPAVGGSEDHEPAAG